MPRKQTGKKPKKESQKQLKKMYGDLAKFAAGLNSPDNSPVARKTSRKKNHAHSVIDVVSIRSGLKPLDKKKDSKED